jgi:hypothetical protein
MEFPWTLSAHAFVVLSLHLLAGSPPSPHQIYTCTNAHNVMFEIISWWYLLFAAHCNLMVTDFSHSPWFSVGIHFQDYRERLNWGARNRETLLRLVCLEAISDIETPILVDSSRLIVFLHPEQTQRWKDWVVSPQTVSKPFDDIVVKVR